MTKKDFFVLMIKLFGLYWIVVSLFSGLTQNFLLLSNGIDGLSFLWFMMLVAVDVGIFAALVFYADKVAGLLKLDKGFDDDKIILGNLQTGQLIKIGVFVVGGLLFLHYLPDFLSMGYFAFRGKIAGRIFDAKDSLDLVGDGLRLLIGYWLMTRYDSIAGWFVFREAEKE